MPLLQNRVMEFLHDIFQDVKVVHVCCNHNLMIYKNTLPGSPFRRFCVDSMLMLDAGVLRAWIDGHPEQWTSEMLADIAVAAVKRLNTKILPGIETYLVPIPVLGEDARFKQ